MRRNGALRQMSPLKDPGCAYCSLFSVGGVSVALQGECGADVTLVPNLEPFRAETDFPDINISVAWAGRLPQAQGRRLFDSGSVWSLYECHQGFQFDFGTPMIGEFPYKRLVVDEHFRRAQLLLSRECFEHRSPAFPLEYPLDEVLITHRLAHERAIELHGCGIVGPDGVGNLFVGHSGAGKSTTARLWSAREDVEVLSDDRIIIRQDAVHGESGRVVMYGTPWHGEAAFASPANACLARILILQHGRGNTLTRLSPSQAVAELFARSFVPFHRHAYVSAALEFLQDVANAVPCYRYSFEPDEGAVERILGFHD
jgi:hypothetical protein